MFTAFVTPTSQTMVMTMFSTCEPVHGSTRPK
jgi:hypothetical protein